MTWVIAKGTEERYEVDEKRHLVRNKRTHQLVGERTNKRGSKFYRVTYGGKKHCRSFRSLLECDYPNDYTRTCPICGKEFTAYHARARFCSKRCKKRNDNVEYNGFHVRRAREQGVDYETGITLPLLIERDGGVCQICGEKVDRSIWAKMPTVDHIVPISKGGTHTWDNVQLACMGCNTKKANSLC